MKELLGQNRFLLMRHYARQFQRTSVHSSAISLLPHARRTKPRERTGERRATRADGEVGVCKRCVSLQDVFFTALPSNFELSVKFNSFIRLLSDFRAGSKNFTKIGIPKPPLGLRVGL